MSVLGAAGVIWRLLGGLFEASWRPLRRLLGPVGAPLRALLGRSWEPLVALLEPYWRRSISHDGGGGANTRLLDPS
eukprot:1381972-Pyramimonas_sp.AAC.1